MITCEFIIKEVAPGTIAFQMVPDNSQATPLELMAATRFDVMVAEGLKSIMQEAGEGYMVEKNPKTGK